MFKVFSWFEHVTQHTPNYLLLSNMFAGSWQWQNLYDIFFARLHCFSAEQTREKLKVAKLMIESRIETVSSWQLNNIII